MHHHKVSQFLKPFFSHECWIFIQCLIIEKLKFVEIVQRIIYRIFKHPAMLSNIFRCCQCCSCQKLEGIIVLGRWKSRFFTVHNCNKHPLGNDILLSKPQLSILLYIPFPHYYYFFFFFHYKISSTSENLCFVCSKTNIHGNKVVIEISCSNDSPG